jgi:hypothetical protein
MLVVAGRILIRASVIGLFLLGFGSAAFAQDLTRGVGVHSMSSCAKVSGCLNLDASIAHPEAITGSWETRVASGEIVGLSIAALTSVSGAPTSLVGLNQHVQFYRLVTYVRDGGSTKRTWWHTAVDGYFDWQQNRLHFRDTRSYVLSCD